MIMQLSRFLLLLSLPGLLVLLGLFGATPAQAQAIAIDKVLVVVNQEAITLSEYEARHRREVLQQTDDLAPFDGSVDQRILERMIDDRIQAQAALRRGIRIPDSQVSGAIAFVAEQNNTSPQRLLEGLAQDGITPRQFRASIREQQLIRRLVDVVVNSRVVINDQEIDNYLASHKELIASDEAYNLSHLFVALEGKSESEAQAEYENLAHIRRGLVAGHSFEQSVRAFSDSSNKEEGGRLGWLKIDQLPQLFVQTLRQTEVGEVSEIIKSSNGLHLLKLHDRRQSGKIVEQQQLRHILIRPDAGSSDADAREQAEQLRARIDGGEEFEKIARAYSADQASGINGGGLGWTSPGDFSPEFEAATRALPLNEVSAPVRTQAGYHLVEVQGRRERDISLELARKQARQVIFRRKAAEIYDNWYRAIRAAAHIEYASFTPA